MSRSVYEINMIRTRNSEQAYPNPPVTYPDYLEWNSPDWIYTQYCGKGTSKISILLITYYLLLIT